MAGRLASSPISVRTALSKLRKSREQIAELTPGGLWSGQAAEWQRNLRSTLTRIYPQNSSRVHEFDRISFEPPLGVLSLSVILQIDEQRKAFLAGFQQAKVFLDACIRELEKQANGNSTSSRATGSDESKDRQFSRLAIEEARKSTPENDGRTHPLVGAVVVKDGKILARSHRGEAEGNHAEYIALEKKLANASLAGATVYTTLEPCTTRNHPKIPCALRLIERKVRRVVIGMLDPDPRITGRGQRKLRSANIITDLFPHDLMSEVEDLNRAFTRSFEAVTQSTEFQRRLTWPQHLGTYTASSSKTIPDFPSELSGYRFEAGKDFWGKPFLEKGGIRVFQGGGWQGIHEFPATMNGCSSGVFMICWRSAHPDMPVESCLGSYNAIIAVDTKPAHGFGYMSGTNCEQPMFKFPDEPNRHRATLVDVYYELKFWQAAP